MNPSTAQAGVVADELVRNGLRHVVVCPGSRNAPLSMALHELAVAGRVRLHVRIDERSAGFLALGLAKGLAGNGLAGVLCTSGTAVANLHPAVLEAHHARIPLLVLTADRPAELHGTGANQTIAQRGLFGAAASCVELPIAQAKAGGNAVWRGLVCRAVARAETGGPVQVNLPFAEPLVPDGNAEWPESLAGRAGDTPWTGRRPDPAHAVRPASDGVPLSHLGPRTVLVAGEDRFERVFAAAEVAAAAGWPVIAEPTVAAPVLAAGAALLGSGSTLLNAAELPAALRPDAVLVVGRPTLSRGVGRLLRAVRLVNLVGEYPEWTDPQHVAELAVSWLDTTDVTLSIPDSDWLDGWRRADTAARTALDKLLADRPWPSGEQVAAELLDAVPDGATLFLGSSNPIRYVELAGRPRREVRVLANRGVAGIDGNVSTAAGIALATGSQSYALLGDLTFLHDVNGLLIGPADTRPDLTVVVYNDDGGGIFALLEQGVPEHAAHFERVFGTPHGADLAALCAGYHVPHVLAGTAAELRAALVPGPGVRVVEVRADRAGLRDRQAELRAAVDSAVRAAIG